MSYILKALRKSEAERAKGTVPRLTTRHDSQPLRRKGLWPTLAAGALLANVGLVALVLWQPGLLPGQWGADDPADGQQAEIPQHSTAETAAVAAAEKQVASLVGTGEVDPAEVQPNPDETAGLPEPLAVAPAVLEPAAAPLPEAGPEAGSDMRLEAETPGPATEQVAIDKAAAEPATPKPVTLGQFLAEDAVTEPVARQETVPQEQPRVAEVPPLPKEKPAFRALNAERAFEDGPAKAPDAVQPARDQLAWAVPEPVVPAPPPAPEPPEPFADVPELWRLSPAFRQSVPEMTISVHVFSPEQSSRFIIIDRRKYLEGDRLNGGVLIEAILPQGVVFNLNGQQFKLISG